MIFIDSYSDNIKYNEHPDCIGKISCEDKRFYDELEKVMRECHRILKPGKILGWLIGDQWVKGVFTPVGFKIFERLCKYFQPVDIICVARRNQTSNTPLWQYRARKFNFFLRGFKYLFIMRKDTARRNAKNRGRKEGRKIKWHQYERKRPQKSPRSLIEDLIMKIKEGNIAPETAWNAIKSAKELIRNIKTSQMSEMRNNLGIATSETNFRRQFMKYLSDMLSN